MSLPIAWLLVLAQVQQVAAAPSGYTNTEMILGGVVAAMAGAWVKRELDHLKEAKDSAKELMQLAKTKDEEREKLRTEMSDKIAKAYLDDRAEREKIRTENQRAVDSDKAVRAILEKEFRDELGQLRTDADERDDNSIRLNERLIVLVERCTAELERCRSFREKVEGHGDKS